MNGGVNQYATESNRNPTIGISLRCALTVDVHTPRSFEGQDEKKFSNS